MLFRSKISKFYSRKEECSYKLDSKYSLKNINNISAETNIEIDFSVENFIQSNLKLKEINIDVSNDKIYLAELSEINEILDDDFVETNNNYDFSFQWVDNKLNLESNLGSNILINGFYKNENDIDLNFEFSNLFIQNFFECKTFFPNY